MLFLQEGQTSTVSGKTSLQYGHAVCGSSSSDLSGFLWKQHSSVVPKYCQRDVYFSAVSFSPEEKSNFWHWTLTHRTMPSIFFLYLRSILSLYSGLINMAAKPNDELRSPDRWHSITVDVSIGTTSAMKYSSDGVILFVIICVFMSSPQDFGPAVFWGAISIHCPKPTNQGKEQNVHLSQRTYKQAVLFSNDKSFNKLTRRKFADVVGHTNEHSSAFQMISFLHVYLH